MFISKRKHEALMAEKDASIDFWTDGRNRLFEEVSDLRSFKRRVMKGLQSANAARKAKAAAKKEGV